ncbi:D-alanyl-D-alanine carboxypeptidase family protein [Cohnella silvisoli]|uniref:D-alanyl-D-alanine carboxypeptidase family protein n=1 Tax=Cohnella silvisoli TaxID=2873699 RepID=A0ABV1KWB9_9BACL|nr:D-alanyl-D-alanine carboxypeptidase family protein [Cohnella silvisoli]MCD9023994.1 M15 family metallopeptidase [Cohnella silvisoli]
MKKKVVFTALIGVIVVGGLWSQVNANTQTKSAAVPEASQQQPSIEPSSKPTVEPSSEPAKNPKPSEKPPSKPSVKPPAETKPPVKETSISSLLADNLPRLTVKKNKDGLAVVTNTSSLFVLVNKKRNLPSSYAPKDLVIPNVPFSFSGDSPKKQMRKEAAKALEALFDAAKDDGIKLKAVSGYRSYATQKAIFKSNADTKGEEVANRTSARPGQSEHQTGLAMDVSSASVGYALEQSFGDTKEGKWLAKHAADHGFIIRFLKGKESITGYSYEPWHVRYVGKELAKDITKKKVTLEQYFDALSATMDNKS